MKISKQDKAQTRRKIVKTAVELMSEKGFNTVSMRSIARSAEIGDATIYKYFPSKEKILIAYYEICAEDTVASLATIDGFSEYELHEKLQVLLDTYLGLLLPDREFVSESFQLIFQSPMFLFGDVNPLRQQLLNTLGEFLDDAWEKEEIPEFPFQNVLPDILCEYLIGVVYFWIKDESEEFHETTQLIDLSLGLIMSLLKSGIINRTTDFFGFMLKSQMFRILNPDNGFMRQILNFSQRR
ncbi:MAG: TetR/AcrR family transcriptional regulator [Gammaproteobacteria bacterium]|nr:TetR/AcrR family transcriptional regulator [Gammaproteobacteria bacterium]MDH5729280.1 TetR/AcrR family transcriptional regulator [Gammaproteobacteria bacterium]